jgi:hypothetical protein
LIGTPTGIDLPHCIYLGVKYNENFLEKVYGYRIIANGEIAKILEEKTHQKYISVEFYAQNVIEDLSDITAEEAMEYWRLHETGQLVEKLSHKAKTQINWHIKNVKSLNPFKDLWYLS